jgi:predicted transcriptional regulator of viral defense system
MLDYILHTGDIMTIVGTFQLRKAIPQEEFDYALLTAALSEYSGVRQKINELLKSGVIVRVKKGLYVFGPGYNNAPVCKEILANLIYGPSCISLEYALSYHGLIPERVEAITSVTPKRDKEFKTPLGRFSYRYLRFDKYPYGIEQVWIDSKHPVLMASPEKAICDYVVLNKVTGITGSHAAMEFLESDLRIDKENWTRFDPNTLRKLNKFYRNKIIAHILEAL